ncbi:MAG: hypothetical protein FH748_05510 [Balneolaceae bacterium]|nr:hypothetical protein [Balneolaceae bacterium]
MYIDHEKLVELLSEASGIEKEKIEKQLKELVGEIHEAIDEGEAYEVDGFGIFSQIGENLVFMPNKDLETEINYKYVGMEPIEVEDTSTAAKETAGEEDEYEDPFGIIGESPEEETPLSTELAEEDKKETKSVEEIADAQEEEDQIAADTEEEAEAKEKPGSDKWGIDSYQDDTSEDVFSGLLGDTPDDILEEDDLVSEEAESEGTESEQEKESKVPDSDLAAEEEDEKIEPEPEDPFAELATDEDDAEGEGKKEETEQDEVVPVITNLSSKKEPKKKETKEKKTDRKQRKAPKKEKQEKKQASPALLVAVIILVLFGGAAALGYFGIVHIPGITPETTTTAQSQPARQSPEAQASTPVAEEANNQEAESQQAEEEKPPVQDETAEEGINNQNPPEQDAAMGEDQPSEEHPQQQSTIETKMADVVPEGQTKYGLRGEPVQAANNGYTIVLFSLSNEENANAKYQELKEMGYRAILDARPSSQYGTLWRISIGQFQTITDAAIASDELGEPYASNYFITEIN